jgi:two-component system, response regulator
VNLVGDTLDILLVEDSTADAELTLRALRKAQLGGRVLWLKDGQAAVDYLFGEGEYRNKRTERPRLVLLDLKLPKLSGIDVLRRLKSTPTHEAIPVAMLTSSSEERDIVSAYALGANSYLVKPVDFEHLAELVASAGRFWLLANRTPR